MEATYLRMRPEAIVAEMAVWLGKSSVLGDVDSPLCTLFQLEGIPEFGVDVLQQGSVFRQRCVWMHRCVWMQRCVLRPRCVFGQRIVFGQRCVFGQRRVFGQRCVFRVTLRVVDIGVNW